MRPQDKNTTNDQKPANPDMFQVGFEAGRLESSVFFLLFGSRRKFFIWRLVESSIGTRCDISSQRTFSAGVEAQEWQSGN